MRAHEKRFANLDRIALAALHLINKLRRVGLTVTFETSHELLKQVYSSAAGKRLSPQFDGDHFDHTPDNTCWLAARDSAGILHSVMAMRYEQIASISLADLITIQHARIYTGNSSGRGLIGSSHCPKSKRIFGSLVYHGETFVSAEYRKKYRVVEWLSYLSQFEACSRWPDVDYIYCFMSSRNSLGGLPNKAGFLHWSPRGVEWLDEPNGIKGSDSLVWNDREDIEYLVHLTADSAQDEMKEQHPNQHQAEI